MSGNKDEELIDIVHPTELITGHEKTEISYIKPKDGILWYDNKVHQRLKETSKLIDIGVVTCALGILIASILLKFDPFLIVLFTVSILSVSLIVHWIPSQLPLQVGLSTEGIHFRYKGKKPPYRTIDFIRWSEIGKIYRQNKNLLKFVFKTIPQNMQFNETYYEFDTELQQRVIDAYEQSRRIEHPRKKPAFGLDPRITLKKTLKAGDNSIKWGPFPFCR